MFGLRCKNWKVCIFYSSQTKFCNQAKIDFQLCTLLQSISKRSYNYFYSFEFSCKIKKIIKTKTFFPRSFVNTCHFLNHFHTKQHVISFLVSRQSNRSVMRIENLLIITGEQPVLKFVQINHIKNLTSLVIFNYLPRIVPEREENKKKLKQKQD